MGSGDLDRMPFRQVLEAQHVGGDRSRLLPVVGAVLPHLAPANGCTACRRSRRACTCCMRPGAPLCHDQRRIVAARLMPRRKRPPLPDPRQRGRISKGRPGGDVPFSRLQRVDHEVAGIRHRRSLPIQGRRGCSEKVAAGREQWADEGKPRHPGRFSCGFAVARAISSLMCGKCPE